MRPDEPKLRAMETLRVREIMTPAPRVVDGTEDTRTARALMEQYGIRHLPVMHHGKLVGILSEREVKAALAFLEHAAGEIGPPAIAICSRDVLAVAPDDPIEEVAMRMANQKAGSAVVVEGDKLVGLVTTTDLCRTLVRLSQRARAQASRVS